MSYSDSHVHLDSFPPKDLEIVFSQMKAKNVSLVLNVSINLRTSEEAVKLAQQYPSVYAAIGIHPGEALALTPEIKKTLEELSGRPRVVAFGEIGLMYGRSTGTKEEQQALFAYQLSLAKNTRKPVDIHYSYDSHKDIIAMIKKEKGAAGIVHGFAGTVSDLNDWLDVGFYISLGKLSIGMLGIMGGMHEMPTTSDEVIRAIPAEKLLTETDSMARMSVSRWKTMGGPKAPLPTAGGPQGPPMKEEFNQPMDVINVAEKIAAVRGFPVEEIGTTATKNLKRLLKIK
jgi:TatD DNase family protein